MKILIYSPSFYPKIGGLETIMATLAHEFTNQGYTVKLVSLTPATDDTTFPFEVIRRPTFHRLLQLTYWCDIFFQGCVSLKGLWPLLLIPRPLVVAHHTWYQRADGSLNWQDRLKLFVTHFATNISVSHAIASNLPALSTIIPNSYQDDVFYELPDSPRQTELVFLGRLVSDKGVHLLLEALAQLKQQGLMPHLTVIGHGSEAEPLHQQVQALGIADQVHFVGAKQGAELTRLLNTHQIMVVPSLWDEPFGIVALEGIACGCVIVGSEGGGLKDAIGSCGMTFPNGNVQALAQALKNLLSNPDQLVQYRKNAAAHLARHHKNEIAKAYLQVFHSAL